MLNEIFTREMVFWLMTAVVGGVIGAFVRGLVSRRMRSVGGVKFLRARIVAEKPHDAVNLAANHYAVELRMHNTSDEAKVVESLLVTFNLHRYNRVPGSRFRLESPMTTMLENEIGGGVTAMNLPFRLRAGDGQALEYVVVPPGEVKIVPAEIEIRTFDFSGLTEPRGDPNHDLLSAIQATHVSIHFQYAGNKKWHSQVIADLTERIGWRGQRVVLFPDSKHSP